MKYSSSAKPIDHRTEIACLIFFFIIKLPNKFFPQIPQCIHGPLKKYTKLRIRVPCYRIYLCAMAIKILFIARNSRKLDQIELKRQINILKWFPRISRKNKKLDLSINKSYIVIMFPQNYDLNKYSVVCSIEKLQFSFLCSVLHLFYILMFSAQSINR